MPKKKTTPAATRPKLTQKQDLFVSYYLGRANGNATEAARLAGYAKPKEQGYENLTKPYIASAVGMKLEREAMSAAECLTRLADVARADIADFLTVEGDEVKVDIAKAARLGKTHLIRSLKPTQFGLSIELHDSMSAVEKLGKYHRLFIERQEISGPDRGPIPVEMQSAIDKIYGDKPAE